MKNNLTDALNELKGIKFTSGMSLERCCEIFTEIMRKHSVEKYGYDDDGDRYCDTVEWASAKLMFQESISDLIFWELLTYDEND